MKKIVLLVVIMVTLIALPCIAKASMSSRINSKDFRMRKMGSTIRSIGSASFIIKRFYDKQTSTMCYVVKKRFSGIGGGQVSISCVVIKKK